MGETFLLQAKAKNEWLDLYAFDLTQYYQPDYQVFNWYTATHPSSLFVNDLVAARPIQTGRHILHNSQYSFYPLDGVARKRQLGSVGEIRELLENEFRIATSHTPRLDSRPLAMLAGRSEEHPSQLHSLIRPPYAAPSFTNNQPTTTPHHPPIP